MGMDRGTIFQPLTFLVLRRKAIPHVRFPLESEHCLSNMRIASRTRTRTNAPQRHNGNRTLAPPQNIPTCIRRHVTTPRATPESQAHHAEQASLARACLRASSCASARA